MAWDLASASVLQLVLNRLVRTRMPGGVGGDAGETRRLYPDQRAKSAEGGPNRPP